MGALPGPGLALESLFPPICAKESLSLSGRRIAFTTPENYGNRLSRLLQLRGTTPLPDPTISVGPTASTLASLRSFLLPFCSQQGGKGALDSFSALAITSRTGISPKLPFPVPHSPSLANPSLFLPLALTPRHCTKGTLLFSPCSVLTTLAGFGFWCPRLQPRLGLLSLLVTALVEKCCALSQLSLV